MLEGLHEAVHGTSGSFSIYAGGYHGLLFSPSRGLLVFSPVVALTAIGLPAVLRAHRSSPMLWCCGAAALQFTLYGSYVVWWGGHTYGPRYMLDLLPLLVPMAVASAHRIRGHLLPLLTGLAVAWSVGVAGLGAFVFPHERWNTDPADVDRHHERLWEWSDATDRAGLARRPEPAELQSPAGADGAGRPLMRILYFADIRFPARARQRDPDDGDVPRAGGAGPPRPSDREARHPQARAGSRSRSTGCPPSDGLVIERANAPAGAGLIPRVGYLSFVLGRAFGRGRADVIVTRDLGVASALLRIPAGMRAPIVYESHGYAPDVAAALPRARRDREAPRRGQAAAPRAA